MMITLSIGLDELSSLPLELREKIGVALNLPITQVPVQPMQYQQPVYQTQMTAPAAPQVQVIPDPVPTKSPVIEGNTRLFLPDRGHPTQQNAAVDVMTGQPQAVAPPQTPMIPQMSNAPVNVSPVATVGPAQPAPAVAPNAQAVRAMAVRLYNNPAMGGADTLNRAVQMSGIGGMANLSEANAGALYQAIVAVAGSV